MQKKDIKNFTIEELKEELGKLSEASYRVNQIFEWMYKRGARSFDEMSTLPRSLRDKLGRVFSLGGVNLKERLKSTDGTEKFLFELEDASLIESVLIPSSSRKTICLSTQVGCKFGCAFCASGLKGFKRDLSLSEILDQILLVGAEVTNLVFMGMGEPLDNFENLKKAIEIMNSPLGMGVGARRITVSTCGIIPGIKRFKEIDLQVNLSISLHAVNNKLRNSLMPVNKTYPLEELIAACDDFSGRMITLEYILIKDKNDSPEDADELSRMAKKLKAKINLIPYSPVSGKRFKAPTWKDIELFQKRLVKNSINVTLRESKGKDILAACGQLAMR